MSRLRRLYGWFDDRLDLEGGRSILGKAFPAEDSFLLGEVALFCFVLLVLSGMFLGFFYEPSISNVEYEGSVAEYQGEEMPESYVSVLNITYDVPFGMLLRRMHHWAAHLMVASMALHMLRVFFTGAYRNPRELNWVVGTALAGATMFAAYTGYALPFDEFASTAVGIGYNVALSIPIIGETVANIAFGGSFPSSATIPRFYFLHILVLPLVIAGLIGVHMAILVRQKHTEAQRDEDVMPAGPTRAAVDRRTAVEGDSASGGTAADGGSPSDSGTAADGGAVAHGGGATKSRSRQVDRDDDSVVVGLPAFPNQVAVSAVVFFLTLATLSLLAGFLPVHNIAEYGPNDPASTPSLIMPDWFLMWGYGFLKLIPSWMSFDLLGIHFSAEFIGGLLLPGIIFGVVALWPFIDYDEKPVHFTADPLERPFQTAVGVAAVLFIMIASIAGMDVIVADIVGMSTAQLKPYFIGSLIAIPILGGLIVYAGLGGFEDEDGENRDGETDEEGES
ncbi:MAG: cytochrome bc complex cytochrome b subunit [Halovenus sp.]